MEFSIEILSCKIDLFCEISAEEKEMINQHEILCYHVEIDILILNFQEMLEEIYQRI